MRLLSRRLSPVIAILLFCTSLLSARGDFDGHADKQFDLTKYHNVGNIWLRVSNYGFFGSGNDISPQYPSLEYPGGSGIDYLYQGALWFGAKKVRRNALNEKLFWVAQEPSADSSDVISESELPSYYDGAGLVVDTLVSVGFDGDADLYEFLPAYNPLENNNPNVELFFGSYNADDHIVTASIRNQRRGVDDDGDGQVDEDFIGYTFPLRSIVNGNELPPAFAELSGIYLHDQTAAQTAIILDEDNNAQWFPLGFMDLSASDENEYFNFATPRDDDGDMRQDEDGAPVSEQDFISYYYDYSPFGYEGQRDWGGARSRNDHFPLNIRVRQMSYQWSYEYIKNLVYVEFNVTNMNPSDTLIDCAMGVYMDSDVGPQSWDSEKAQDDKSGYVKGENWEFAYTKDADGDGGLTEGLVGSRVCSPVPNPDSLNYACWYWEVGDGPDDSNPQSFNLGGKKTNNEKYWLLVGKQPDNSKYQTLRSDVEDEYEQLNDNDTRYLFAFSGAQPGSADYNETDAEGNFFKRWNLPPKATMKIVIALFPGNNLEELKSSAAWAKSIYGRGQTLTNVTLPDIVMHYDPPEPPTIPNLLAEVSEDGNTIDYYWDNRSILSYDLENVENSEVGWQNANSEFDSYFTNYDEVNYGGIIEGPNAENTSDQETQTISPTKAYRLRHDFQGYRIWIRSGSGSQEDWELVKMWGKIDTDIDIEDYTVNMGVSNSAGDEIFKDYGGYTAIDTGLPDARTATEEDVEYYHFNEYYNLVPLEVGDTYYGDHIYNSDFDYSVDMQTQANAIAVELGAVISENNILTLDQKAEIAYRLAARTDIRKDIFLALFDETIIPLNGFGGQSSIGDDVKLADMRKDRLTRRYYHWAAQTPVKGIETYVAVTAFDRGMPSKALDFLETGRDEDANMKVFFPAANRRGNDGSDVYVVPNPYIGSSAFDGRRENDEKGDKSKRIWFVNLPENCTVKIYSLAGDIIDEFKHEGAYQEDIITVSKATEYGLAVSSIHAWDLISKNNQIVAPGVYLFSVKDKSSGDVHVGKFVLIK